MTDTYSLAREQLERTGAVTLPGRTLRMWGMALLALGFAVTGAAMVVVPLSDLPFGSSRRDSPLTVLGGAMAVVLFGALVPIFAARAPRQRRALTLSYTGLAVEGGPWIDQSWIRDVRVGAGRGSSVDIVLYPFGMEQWSRHRPPLLAWMHRRSGVVPVPPLRGMDPAQTAFLILAAWGRLR